jgi:hypothetical protein
VSGALIDGSVRLCLFQERDDLAVKDIGGFTHRKVTCVVHRNILQVEVRFALRSITDIPRFDQHAAILGRVALTVEWSVGPFDYMWPRPYHAVRIGPLEE